MPSPVNRYILLPLSTVYRVVIWIRHKLFDTGVLKQKRFSPFILVVGNLQAGGTGKTPQVIALAERLSLDFTVAILSRGYKRKSKGFRWIKPDDRAEIAGDEPLEIKRRLPEVPVAVDANRRRGIQSILKDLKTAPDIILLDDGFQHRYIQPDFSLVLTRSNQLFSQDDLLPSGRLREPVSCVKRATAIGVTYAPVDFDRQYYRDALGLQPDMPLWLSHPEYSFDHEPGKGSAILLVTAIAQTDDLESFLNKHYSVIRHLQFKDHHSYNEQDIDRIIRTFNSLPGSQKQVVTTGKDLVKLAAFSRFNELPVSTLQVRLKLETAGEKQIIEYVKRYYKTG